MITAATARVYLDAPETDDTLLTGIIERATAILSRSIGMYLGTPAERIVEVSATGPLLVLADDVLTPTVEDPIVVEYLDADWEYQELEEGVDYRRNDRKFIHRTCWPKGHDNLRVTYRSGWALDSGPAELRDLVLRLTAASYRNRGESGGLQSETLSDFSWTKKDDSKLEADWTATVKAWSRLIPI